LENFDFEFWANVSSTVALVFMFWYLLMGVFVSRERIHVHRVIVPIIIIMLEVAEAVFNTKLEKDAAKQIVLILLYALALFVNILRIKNMKKRMQEKTRDNH
jgi:hypothetical protein